MQPEVVRLDTSPLQLATPAWSAPSPSCATPDEAVAALHQYVANGDTAKALAVADQAVRTWPAHVPLLLAAANLAKRVGRSVAAYHLLQAAERSGSAQAATERRILVNQCAPHWHFRMMNDEVRNQAYDRALLHYVNDDSIVLDIGCGAGLLSMMAARAGARHVYACEVSELMADQARAIMRNNGFAERITVINRLSNHLKVGRELPEKADIVVAEVFDTGLLGENALRTFDHAREHLLKPDGRILPLSASVQAVLLESELLRKEAVTTRCCGFDVTSLNALAPPYVQARLSAFPHHVLSEPLTVGHYGFQRSIDANDSRLVEFEATRAGTCHGVAFWFTLDFGQGITMSTGPENRWNCWMQAVSAFESPVRVQAAERVRVRYAELSNQLLQFSPASS
ncbi:MAG: 50S ribosomal protein L11 methyltransferase [Pseudomonadota bacterium]